MLAKKKKAKKAWKRLEKEKEITRQVQAGESWSDVEAELVLEEPIEMGGDTSASEGAIMTSTEHHEPVATSVDGGSDTEMHGDVPKSTKCIASKDTALEREAKQAQLLRHSKASSAPCPLL